MAFTPTELAAIARAAALTAAQMDTNNGYETLFPQGLNDLAIIAKAIEREGLAAVAAAAESFLSREAAAAFAANAARDALAAKGSSDAASALAAAFQIDPAQRLVAPPTKDVRFQPDITPADVSAVRSGVGTRRNKFGSMDSIAANAVRHDYDPVTGAYRGALVEPASSNLFTYPSDFSNGVWGKTASSIVAAPAIPGLAAGASAQAMGAITVLYWTAFGVFGVPGYVLIQTATLVLMFMLLGVMWKWALPTVADLAQGRSSGSTQLMLGILIWAVSTEVVLGWTFVWRYLDNPQWMVDHPILGFARMWSAVGAALMITSAGARTGPITPASWIWISIASGLGGIVAGMLIMSSFQTPHVALDGNAVYREGRFVCTQAWPVIVSASGVYHTMDSPFRAMVERPVACFNSPEEAEAEGFRAPG